MGTASKEAFVPERCHKILVAGCGFMGESIASIFAAYGHEVFLFDNRGAEYLETSKKRIAAAAAEYRRIVGGGGDKKNSTEDQDAEIAAAILPKLVAAPPQLLEVSSSSTSTAAAELLDSLDFVFEAVFEDLEVKCQLFAALAEQSQKIRDGLVPLCSNTSSLLLADMQRRLAEISGADNGANKTALAVAHFQGPALWMPLVELYFGGADATALYEGSLVTLLSSCHKRPIVMRREVPGFVHARLQACLVRECLALVREGVCNAEDVDDAVTFGFGRRYNEVGPLKQADIVGLDLIAKTHNAIFPSLCNDTSDPFTAELAANGSRGGKDLSGYLQWPCAATVESTKKKRDDEVKRRLVQDFES
ncbi:unnamed protein product [Amoebophrya sp. A25]|nr:unnamed protein product [Amoebophrya sp. A25]|eukprot:GSA25T00020045001.1